MKLWDSRWSVGGTPDLSIIDTEQVNLGVIDTKQDCPVAGHSRRNADFCRLWIGSRNRNSLSVNAASDRLLGG
jgi:hypothetical protein